MLQDLQWDGCRKETDYYEKSYGSRRNSDFRDTQVDIKDNSWSVEAGLRTCQNNSSSIHCNSLYSKEDWQIPHFKEDLSFYRSQNEEKQAAIVKCYVKRYRRAKMSGLQKRYYAKLYQIGKLKKKPYSQAWKYKDDIRKMHKLQEQYLFLVRHKIESAEELVSVLDNLTDKKKEASKEKSKTYKAKEFLSITSWATCFIAFLYKISG